MISRNRTINNINFHEMEKLLKQLSFHRESCDGRGMWLASTGQKPKIKARITEHFGEWLADCPKRELYRMISTSDVLVRSIMLGYDANDK